MEKAEIRHLVLECLREVLVQADKTPPETLGGSTQLIGERAVLDSLGLVKLIVDVEQRLAADHSLSVTLADERAMSQKKSPFRSVGALTDYISLLSEEH